MPGLEPTASRRPVHSIPTSTLMFIDGSETENVLLPPDDHSNIRIVPQLSVSMQGMRRRLTARTSTAACTVMDIRCAQTATYPAANVRRQPGLHFLEVPDTDRQCASRGVEESAYQFSYLSGCLSHASSDEHRITSLLKGQSFALPQSREDIAAGCDFCPVLCP